MVRRHLLVLAAGAWLSASVVAAAPTGPAARPSAADPAREALALFQKRCVKCHGGIKRQGGLSLLHREAALAPAASGRRAIVPGRPDAGELLRRVAGHGGRMPPDGPPLTRAEIALLRSWIAQGAPWPRHWSLQPLRPVLPPPVRDAAWPRNPIDRFVLARLEAEGLRPSPEADPHTLIRRLYLDLAGLPPPPDEVEAFVSEYRAWKRLNGADHGPRTTDHGAGFRDQVRIGRSDDRPRTTDHRSRTGASTGLNQPTRQLGAVGTSWSETKNAAGQDNGPNPYDNLVDRLLASPHFGERWGRHWLDLARYADSDGYEVDKARPNAWYWRDWVIRAVNEDLPFDRFTVEQLAGDLLPGATPEQRLATGFHRNTLTNNEGGIDKEEYRVKAVMDRVSTTGSVWLGLTVGCAQCHDHPTEAVSQRDYYALYALFNNADETDLAWPLTGPDALRQAKDAHERALRELRSKLVQAPEGEQAGLRAKISELEQAGPRPPSVGLAVLSERAEPRATFLFDRGDFLRPRKDQPVAPRTPQALHPLRLRNPGGRPDRLDLARWLVDPANPLTPRVAVNDVWLRLFGAGLVPTPEDFGATGEAPTHPLLLDYLASLFSTPAAPAGKGVGERGSGGMGGPSHSPSPPFSHSPTLPLSHTPNQGSLGWSRKQLIRLIVTSAVYRQASRHRPEVLARDPANRLLHRQNRFRVEGEIVRDLHLAASGLLSRKIGGPSVFPPIPPDLEKISFRSQLPWKTSTGEDRYRRGMYTFFKRSLPDPNLTLFDCPDSNATLARRSSSNTPVQALAALNNVVYVEASRAMGRRVLREAGPGDEQRIVHLFRLCVARPPSAAESSRLLGLLRASRDWYRSHSDDAKKLAGEEPWGEAVAADSAAWTAVAGIVMNLDEFITRE